MKAWIIFLLVIGSIFLLLCVLLGFSFIKYLIVSLINKKRYLTPKKEITFLSECPMIDGQLDESLVSLPTRKFNSRIRLLPFQPSCRPSYRLAYGCDFFYIYIEIAAKKIVKRDRGFQYGDGFHMLLANPIPNHQLTDEFYVFGFSPNSDSEGNLEKYIWYHDIKVKLSKLGNDVKFVVKKNNGKIGYELLLPWNETYPYHPWIMKEGIGFNLAFIKARKSLFEYYSTIFDWRFQAENKKRKYALMKFATPRIKEGMQSFVVMNRNCLEGSMTLLKFATLSTMQKKETLKIKIASKNGEIITSEEITFSCKEGLNQISIEIPTQDLTPGSYTIQWHIGSANGEKELTILPIFNFDELTSRVESCQSKISMGSFHTLNFMLNQINKEINQIKWYENYTFLMDSIIELLDIIQKAENGEDVLASKIGHFRRAFISNIDNTLQPYSVTVPENYDSSRKYPLLVFLHGSGVDDRNSLRLIDYIEGNYIKLAPKTRGVSHYFGKQETLIDIVEAISDMKLNYNIDENAIILSGFSMGGYGVYRTYMEYPTIFKGLAILSGEPKLNFFVKLITKGKFVNFLKQKYIQIFKQIPIFIFHGTLDKSCSYDDTAFFVERLRGLHGEVEFYNDKVGHKKLENQEIIEKFNQWLQRIILF